MVEEKMVFVALSITSFLLPLVVTLYFTGQLDKGNFLQGDFLLGAKYGVFSFISYLFLQVSRLPYFIGLGVYIIYIALAISTFPLWFGMDLNIHFWVININTALIVILSIYLIAAAFISWFETKGATSYEGFS